MPYDDFVGRVKFFARKAKCKVSDLSFRHEDGRHFANLPDGVSITGNTVSKRLAVRWGSGHVAYI